MPKCYNAWRREQYGAFIYGKRGNQFAFHGTELFEKAEVHPKADSIDDLVNLVRPTVEAAIADFETRRTA